MNDDPKYPEAKNKRPSRFLTRLMHQMTCAWAGHSIYSCRTDGGSPFHRSPVDDWVEVECLRCGKTLRAPYGLALPNLKLGSPPNA